MALEITWTSPSGQTINLTDEFAGYRVLADGTRGLRSVPYEIVTQQYAGMDGVDVQDVRALPNQPTLGLRIRATGEEDLTAKVRGLVHRMRPKAGLGLLTVSQPNGERRSLRCYCMEGLEGAEDTSSTLCGRWWKTLLRFYAPDPWWLGQARALRFGLGAPVPFFPIPPVTLSPSTVQGQFSVDLDDVDAESFPVWTVTGPGSTLVLQNRTTGRRLTVGVDLAAGQTLVVDTRASQRALRVNGTNALPQVLGYPDLWPLVEGLNEITVSLTGATGATQIEGVYEPRYAGI